MLDEDDVWAAFTAGGWPAASSWPGTWAPMPRARADDGGERRRRAAHNAVERRRRDAINNQIMELALLLPEEALREALDESMQGGMRSVWRPGEGAAEVVPAVPAVVPRAPAPPPVPAAAPRHSCLHDPPLCTEVQRLARVSPRSAVLAHAHFRPNKGTVLRKSVAYVCALQRLVGAQQERIARLAAELGAVYSSGGG